MSLCNRHVVTRRWSEITFRRSNVIEIGRDEKGSSEEEKSLDTRGRGGGELLQGV